jgi:Ca-activated chloride channel family protein
MKITTWLTAILLIPFLLSCQAQASAPKTFPAEDQTIVSENSGGTTKKDTIESWLFGTIHINEVKGGTLGFLTDETDVYLMAPTVKTDVIINVSGAIGRTRIRQRFHNPSKEWQEADYIFPLPEKAAVDSLTMTVGNRVISGVIKKKEEAKEIYEKAKSEGKKTALASEKKNNIFFISLANIGPDEFVDVEIEYQESYQWDDSGFHLRFPMVVAPQYTPTIISDLSTNEEVSAPKVEVSESKVATDKKPSEQSALISPVTDSVAQGPHISLTVNLIAGFPIDKLTSPSHKITVRKDSKVASTISLTEKIVPANCDFVLNWLPVQTAAPQSCLFTEKGSNDELYALLMLLPPEGKYLKTARIPRETILVIDTSGSMSGESIKQARRSLLQALEKLHNEDSFNVIQFNSICRALFNEPSECTQKALDEAKTYIKALKAGGGTEMMIALEEAFMGNKNASQKGKDRIRQIIFITDGQVDKEEELFRYIKSNIRNDRLFTVGIGSAPNINFMKKAASHGKGIFTFIDNINEVENKMEALFTKTESPVLTGLNVNWQSEFTDIYPPFIPDLYSGEPLVVSAKLSGPSNEIIVTGRGGKENLIWKIPLINETTNAGIGKLWAKSKIESLMDSISRTNPETKIKAEVTKIALSHNLVSKYTSLVAVDEESSRPKDENLIQKAVRRQQPKRFPLRSYAKTRPASPLTGSKNFQGTHNSGVPEPETWILIIVTFFLIGFAAIDSAKKNNISVDPAMP